VKSKTLLLISSLLIINLPNAWSASEIQKSQTDDEIRQNIVGSWIIDTQSSDGISINGIISIDLDNTLALKATITKGEGRRDFEVNGTWQVKEGYLVETVVSDTLLNLIGKVTRDKIISVDDYELTYQTENGKTVTRERNGPAALPLNLGSGEPGLHIIYNTTNDFPIYQYVILLDEPWTVGSALIGGFYERNIQILADRNFGLKEKFRSRSWWHGDMLQLYPFDENTVFTCEGGMWGNDFKTWNYFPRKTQVFSTNQDNILISHDVYSLACSRYGLATNQLFLGKIGTNIFYWETQKSTIVYYRTAEGAHTTNYFKLPKRVIDIHGVTKSVSTNMNVGFSTFSKSTGWFHYSPYTFEFIEVSLKNGKQVGSTK
jgi:hypothetical protein